MGLKAIKSFWINEARGLSERDEREIIKYHVNPVKHQSIKTVQHTGDIFLKSFGLNLWFSSSDYCNIMCSIIKF